MRRISNLVLTKIQCATNGNYVAEGWEMLRNIFHSLDFKWLWTKSKQCSVNTVYNLPLSPLPVGSQ